MRKETLVSLSVLTGKQSAGRLGMAARHRTVPRWSSADHQSLLLTGSLAEIASRALPVGHETEMGPGQKWVLLLGVV